MAKKDTAADSKKAEVEASAQPLVARSSKVRWMGWILLVALVLFGGAALYPVLSPIFYPTLSSNSFGTQGYSGDEKIGKRISTKNIDDIPAFQVAGDTRHFSDSVRRLQQEVDGLKAELSAFKNEFSLDEEALEMADAAVEQAMEEQLEILEGFQALEHTSFSGCCAAVQKALVLMGLLEDMGSDAKGIVPVLRPVLFDVFADDAPLWTEVTPWLDALEANGWLDDDVPLDDALSSAVVEDENAPWWSRLVKVEQVEQSKITPFLGLKEDAAKQQKIWRKVVLLLAQRLEKQEADK